MRITCSQERLASVLQHMSRIKHDPSAFVSLLATRYQGKDTLSVQTLSLYGNAGLCFMIEGAMLEEEGEAHLSIEPLASYVQALREGELLLTHQYELTAPHTRSSGEGGGAIFELSKASSPLHVLRRGVSSTDHAQLTCWQGEPFAQPALSTWMAMSRNVTTLPARELKALGVCLPFAMHETRQTQGNPETGVLLHAEEHCIRLCATTGTTLAQVMISLPTRVPCPLSGLFPASALSTLHTALSASANEDEITLLWATDGPSSPPILLVCTEQWIWFCRQMDVAVPSTWEQTLALPHQQELRISRKMLEKPLRFYAQLAEAAPAGTFAMVLETRAGRLLCSPSFCDKAQYEGQHEIDLLSSSTDLHLLLDPQTLRRLIRLLPEEIVTLHIGSFEREEEGETGKKTIGFVRLSAESICLMMGVSRIAEVRTQEKGAMSPVREVREKVSA